MNVVDLPVVDTLAAAGEVLLSILNMFFTIFVNGIAFFFDAVWQISSLIINYIFSSAGFLTGVAKILPSHLYAFAVVCASAYSIRAVAQKVGG